MYRTIFENLKYADRIPFKDLHEKIYLRIRLAMKSSGRKKVADKFSYDQKEFQNLQDFLRYKWEGYHLLEFANTIRPEDEKGKNNLNAILGSYGIGGFEVLQKIPSEIRTSFTLKKSEAVFKSLAKYQDIPLLVCFLNFLEFCRYSFPYRPLDVFDGETKELVTLEEVIADIKQCVISWERNLNENSQKSLQPTLTIPDPEIGNINYYANTALTLIGREDQKKRLIDFLQYDPKENPESDSKIVWFQLAGVTGQGKSRLALDLISDLGKVEFKKELGYWRAGFLTENDINSFEDCLDNWEPNTHHLLIFDNIIGQEVKIKSILQKLICRERQKKFLFKIRILFLEKQRWDQGNLLETAIQKNSKVLTQSTCISDKAQWFLNLGEDNDPNVTRLMRHCFENGVEELTELEEEKLTEIVRRLVHQFFGKEITLSDHEIKETLKRIDGSGRPLYAYLLAQQLNTSEEGYKSWTEIDLLRDQLERDRFRWKVAFEKNKAPTWGDSHPAMKLTVLATIIGELRVDDPEVMNYFGIIDSSLGNRALSITSGCILNEYNRPQEIVALKPYLLGEWFVLYCFLKGLQFEGLLNIAWQYRPNETAMFIQRITQDFLDVSDKKYNIQSLIERLIAYEPPQENHYQALASVVIDIAHEVYRRDLIISRNIILALEYAANHLNPFAQIYLGVFYLEGRGVKKNTQKGIELLESTAQTESSAMVVLGMYYDEGKWVAQNLGKAYELYKRALKQGNKTAFFNLALCYEKGNGVEQNLRKAIKLYERAAKYGDSRAMVNLAACYENGSGVEQDQDIAIELYHRAIKKGDSTAMNNFGASCEKGFVDGCGPKDAIKLYQRAVNLGNSTAMTNLGYCYANGAEVEQDWGRAINLYERAVKLGNGIAMINLGLCYQKGEGVKQNWQKALHLFQDAVKTGVKEAIGNVEIILLLNNFLRIDNYLSLKIDRPLPNLIFSNLTTLPAFDLPILSGEWKHLNSKELLACLEKVATAFEGLELINNLEGYHGQYARCLPLSFYKDCNLIDIQFYSPNFDQVVIISAIFNTNHALLLNRDRNLIYFLNSYLLSLDSQESVIDYLRFFCSYFQLPEKPFQIVSDLNEIPFDKEVSKTDLDNIKKSLFNPRYVEGSFEREGWQEFKTCVLHEGAIITSSFVVSFDGMVSLQGNDEIISIELPILQRLYSGIYRSDLRSLQLFKY